MCWVLGLGGVCWFDFFVWLDAVCGWVLVVGLVLFAGWFIVLRVLGVDLGVCCWVIVFTRL